MSKELLFWILMLFQLIAWGWGYRTPDQPWVRGGGYLITFVLFLILGWAQFGTPVR